MFSNINEDEISKHKKKSPTYRSWGKGKPAKPNPFRQTLKKSLKLPKYTLMGYFLLTLLGYQPVFGIPPIHKSVAYAEFSQQQSIDSNSFSEPFQLPHPGYLTTRYSSYHPGVDIATGLGMPIRPIMKGTVVEVHYGFFGLGHHIVIQHEQNLKSIYGHMGRIFVKQGQEVNSTSILGEVGMTGNTSGPHTHLEIKKGDSYIDPLTILPEIQPLSSDVYKTTVQSARQTYTSNTTIKIQTTQKTTTQPPTLDFKKELSFNL